MLLSFLNQYIVKIQESTLLKSEMPAKVSGTIFFYKLRVANCTLTKKSDAFRGIDLSYLRWIVEVEGKQS